MSARKNSWVKSAFSALDNNDVKSTRTTKTPAKKPRTGTTSVRDRESSTLSTTTDNKCSTKLQIQLSSVNWTDAFAPTKIDELAVHPKKIEELQEWLKHCDAIRRSHPAQICIITGPTGAGKTAALKVLAQASHYDLQEWVNPVDKEAVTMLGDQPLSRMTSQVDAFKSFLLRASRYKSLLSDADKRILLVEDFPNALISDAATFATILEDYMCYGKSPLVFIVTDAKSKQLNIVYNLFPDDIKAKYNIKHISFNPVAPTLMGRAMKRFCTIMSQEGSASIYQAPQTSLLDSISTTSQGDIRNALINLHFSSLKGAPCVVRQQLEVTSKGQNQKKQYTLKSVGRSESVTMLHLLGRVLNPKYNDDKQLIHSPETIVEQLSTEPKKMVNFIHANYVAHFSNIEDLVTAADGLSRADNLLRDYREDALAFSALNIATRSVMVANSSPASGWKPVRGPNRLIVAQPPRQDLKDFGLRLNMSGNLYASEYSTYLKFIPKVRLLGV